MTRDEATAALTHCSILLRRFDMIASGPPYFQYIEQEFARITIDGNEATVTWPEAESGYEGSCSLERKSFKMPAHLLFMGDEEIAAWKAEQETVYERDQQERKAAEARALEAKERSTLAALKAKYEK